MECVDKIMDTCRVFALFLCEEKFRLWQQSTRKISWRKTLSRWRRSLSSSSPKLRRSGLRNIDGMQFTDGDCTWKSWFIQFAGMCILKACNFSNIDEKFSSNRKKQLSAVKRAIWKISIHNKFKCQNLLSILEVWDYWQKNFLGLVPVLYDLHTKTFE